MDRLLTSGQAQSAEEGTAVLRDLRARAQQLAAGGAHRVAILAGAGVAPGNVARLVADAGVDQVHGACVVCVGEVVVPSDVPCVALCSERGRHGAGRGPIPARPPRYRDGRGGGGACVFGS